MPFLREGGWGVWVMFSLLELEMESGVLRFVVGSRACMAFELDAVFTFGDTRVERAC